MKPIALAVGLLLTTVLAGCATKNACFNACCMTAPSDPLRHVVVFKFKEGTSGTKILEIVNEFRKLKDKIPGIIGFEWGRNESPEKLDQGFTHVFTVSFTDSKARDVYIDHPAHLEFVGILKPHMEKVFVVDYKAGK